MTSTLCRPRAAAPPGGEPLQAMYDQHARALLAYAERFTSRPAAEDAVQETFLRAWRNRARLGSDPRPVRPWLMLVLRRLLIDAHRADRVRPISLGEDPVLDRAVDGGFDLFVDRRRLAGALERLSDAHRDVLIEVYYRDVPIELVAADLGVPSGTVRSRLHYAVRALRRQLTTSS
ncbi:sigma-70 family RNA polymerase sigma factor [Pseudonocardia sp. GCM10023141]|uniref:sigma-70 family RNA polymerase sigma factor n=1 Tax=Pseudonocardia sp. GCM10023141 TaxID=3252653 RepID=UPI003608D334